MYLASELSSSKYNNASIDESNELFQSEIQDKSK